MLPAKIVPPDELANNPILASDSVAVTNESALAKVPVQRSRVEPELAIVIASRLGPAFVPVTSDSSEVSVAPGSVPSPKPA